MAARKLQVVARAQVPVALRKRRAAFVSLVLFVSLKLLLFITLELTLTTRTSPDELCFTTHSMCLHAT